MAHTRKILWRGRMRWTPDGVTAWTHDGEQIRLGRHSLDKTRRIADELGYYLGVPASVGAEHAGRDFGAEQVAATASRPRVQRLGFATLNDVFPPFPSPSANGGNSLRNVSQGGGSFPGSAVGTAQSKKQIESALPLNHSHCHLSRNEVIHT